jgi:DUF1680 family protein
MEDAMDKSSRRDFIKSCVGAAAAPSLLNSAAMLAGTPPAEGDAEPKAFLEPFNYDGVRLRDGMLKKQYDATRDYYFNLRDDDILKGFRERAGLPAPGTSLGGWYGGDPAPKEDWPKEWPRLIFSRGDMFNVFGQWLSGMSRMYRATGDKPMLEKATRLMQEWAKTIEPDGYFYYSRNPIAPQYTYDKTAAGLVDMYEFGGQTGALAHVEKITDWAIRNLDRKRTNPNSNGAEAGEGGCEWYTLCENLYRTYKLTGNTKYKTFGDLWRYPAYWGMFSGQSEPTPYGLHAYSHCNTLSSAAMTYAVTGEAQYLKTIVNAYDWFERTQFYATGGYGPGERLLAPDGSLGKSLEDNAATFETVCGSWAGFKLSRYLMRFTGQAKYGDWIEKLVYNGIGAALPMGPNGKTFYYSDYRLGAGRKVYYPAAFPCCAGTYIEAVADYHNIIYFKDASSLYVNLFVPSEVTWNLHGNEIKVEQATEYPEADTTTLTLYPSKATSFNVKIRVPRWSRGVTAAVNGSPVEFDSHSEGWATLARVWNPGDRLTLRIQMEHYLVPIDKQHPKRVALMYGPLVLVRDREVAQIPNGSSLSQWLTVGESPLEFHALARSTGTFVPFYRMAGEAAYVMYFDLEG